MTPFRRSILADGQMFLGCSPGGLKIKHMHDLLKERLNQAAAWSAIALGFSIPVSTAASNFLFALIVLFSLLAGDWKNKALIIARNPAARAALGFLALVLLGCAWGSGDAQDKQHYLVKYLSLLLLPLLIPLFGERRMQARALAAFCAAMLMTLAISVLLWLNALNWLPPAMLAKLTQAQDPLFPFTENAVVFKLSITHGFLMALAAFLLLLASREATSRRWRVLFGLCALLAASNVLLMIIGRTGYVVLAVLGVYYLMAHLGRRQSSLVVLGGLVLVTAVLGFSTTFQTRIHQAYDEALMWQPGQGARTSIGLRFDYYTNAIAIIREHPVLGVGTGGFARAYEERVRGSQVAPSNNPHNQYLLTTAQLGFPGLILLLTLFVTWWKTAGALPEPLRHAARGILLAFLVGNLFNSFMLDFAERLFFAWAGGVLLAGRPQSASSS